MKHILLTLIALLIFQPVLPHYKARYHVVVDTDGGMDDFRAICMMLASPEIEVIAITTVDGILSPEVAANRVRSLLHQFGHQGIPVGTGAINRDKSTATGNVDRLATMIDWGKSEGLVPAGTLPNAVKLLLTSLQMEEMPVDIVALGPLTNVSAALTRHPLLAEEVRTLIWYGREMDTASLNYAFDLGAAQHIMKSDFRMDMVDAGGNTFGKKETLLEGLDNMQSRYAKAVKHVYLDIPQEMQSLPMVSMLGDDCVPLYMLNPEFFTVTVSRDVSQRRLAVARPVNHLTAPVLQIFNSDQEDKSIIFDRFPVDTSFFESDVAAVAGEVIARHGLKEWKVVVVTNEFHEHLGIYSILGAKMGLRAREYFHVGIDELNIVTFAGSNPPVSCMNDGLQASTGGTLGHGTIQLGAGTVHPSARFAFKDFQIELTVRKDIRSQIKKDVGYGVQTFGLDSPEYWTYIRELALKYWLELNRFDIFDIRVIEP